MKNDFSLFRIGFVVLATLLFICMGIEKLMKSSYNKFSDINDGYQLEDVGKGVKVTDSYIYFSKWKNESTYASSAEVMAKYKTLAAKLGGCNVSGKIFSHSETEQSRLTQLDRVVLDRWNFPLDPEYGMAVVEIEITKEKAKYNLNFNIVNIDAARAIKSSVDNAVKSLQAKPEQNRQTLPFIDAVLKVIESGPNFTGIKGSLIGDGDYESLVRFPAGIRPRIYQPALGPEVWLVDLISTTIEEEAFRKYQDIVEQINTSKWNNIGVMQNNGSKTATGESTLWEFSTLNKAYEKTHRDFAMDLVMSKNFRKQWEVYLKIRYDN
jgi:hypothetical protein